MQHGDVKEARFLAGLGHMGEPAAGKIITTWLQNLFKSLENVNCETPCDGGLVNGFETLEDGKDHKLSDGRRVNGVNGVKKQK